MFLKMSSATCQPFYHGLNVLIPGQIGQICVFPWDDMENNLSGTCQTAIMEMILRAVTRAICRGKWPMIYSGEVICHHWRH